MAAYPLLNMHALSARTRHLVPILAALVFVATGCSSMKVTVYPTAEAGSTVAASDPAAVSFLDSWSTDPGEYEVLGHLWAKGKQDFSRSGPGLAALETAMRGPAAALGADAVVGLTNGNSTIWMGSLWYPRPGIGIDTHWASGVAVKKRAPAQVATNGERPIWVTILPVLATRTVGVTASDGSLAAITALLNTAGQYMLGEKGYHADVLPAALLQGASQFDVEAAAVRRFADRACPWADYLLLLALHEPDDMNSEGKWTSAALVSAVYSVGESQWVAMRQKVGSKGELDVADALRAIGPDLEFLPQEASFANAEPWNRSVVSCTSRAADMLPTLKLVGRAR